MFGSVPEINDLFGMPKRPGDIFPGIAWTVGMPQIAGHHRVAALDACSATRIIEGADETAVPRCEIFVIPTVGRWQPNLEADVRSAIGRQKPYDAAERNRNGSRARRTFQGDR